MLPHSQRDLGDFIFLFKRNVFHIACKREIFSSFRLQLLNINILPQEDKSMYRCVSLNDKIWSPIIMQLGCYINIQPHLVQALMRLPHYLSFV